MVVIRLSRGGANKRPFYHIVATDKRSRRDGRSLERLGYFNPIAMGKEVRLYLDLERVNYWLTQGAKPSERVSGLIKDAQKGPEAVAAERTKKAEKLANKRTAAKAAKAAATKKAEATEAPEAAAS